MSKNDDELRLGFKDTKGEVYLIFKAFFSAKDSDLYIHFYNLGINFKTGITKVPIGSNVVLELSPSINGKIRNKIPKLSYHASGQVHFKQDGELDYNFINSRKIEELNNNHIFSIEIADFKKFKKNTKHKDVLIVGSSNGSFKICIAISAVNTPKPITNNTFQKIIYRNNNPFYFNFQVKKSQILNKTNQDGFENGFLVIYGWDETMEDINKESQLLYLY